MDSSDGSPVIKRQIHQRIRGLLLLYIAVLLPSVCRAADATGGQQAAARGLSCPAVTAEHPLERRTGSAGILYNLAEHPKSIRAVATRLLSEALDAPTTAKPACGKGCVAARQVEVVYRVAPRDFVPKAGQQALCLTLEDKTSRKPLRFPTQEFDSVENLNAWVMEFTQGRGPLGKELYEQCGGNCSPRYTFVIAQGAEGLRVRTSVVCGLARDTTKEDYEVSTAVRRRCKPAAGS